MRYIVFVLMQFCFIFSIAQNDNFSLLLKLDNQLEDEPNNPYYLKARGDIYFLMGNYTDSKKDYNKSIMLLPSYFDAYLGRGMTNYHLGYLEDALTDFNLCIQHGDSIYDELYLNRALVYHELKEYEKAIKDYDQAIVLNSKYADAYYNKGLVLQEQRLFDEAINAFNQAISLKPYDALFLINRAYAKYENRQYQTAIIDFEKSLKMERTYKIANKWIALSYLSLGDTNKACRYLKIAKQVGVEGVDRYIDDSCN